MTAPRLLAACHRAALPVLALGTMLLAGCAGYRTPGAAVDVGSLVRGDGPEWSKRAPSAGFPALIAVARIQAPGYAASDAVCQGRGEFCAVTLRDVDQDPQLERLARGPLVSAVVPVSRMLLPTPLGSVKDLRAAASNLRADLLLVYSVDTRFRIDNREIGPDGVISLGLLPRKQAQVVTRASATLFDVRTGFVYGFAEGTAEEKQGDTVWSTTPLVDDVRKRNEAAAYGRMLDEVGKVWKGIVEQFADTGVRHG